MRTIGLATLLALSGCSLVFMETLPADHTPKQEPRCTASTGWPLWDLFIAGTNATVAGVAYVQSNRLLRDYDEDDPRDEDDISDIKRQRNTVMLLSAPVAIAYAASMVYGMRQAGKCEEARAARDEFLSASGGKQPP